MAEAIERNQRRALGGATDPEFASTLTAPFST